MNVIDHADRAFAAQRYAEAANYYEQAIEADPTEKRAYWYLGLALLLQGQEAEAQMAWLMGMGDGDETAIAQGTQDLAGILEHAAAQQAAQEHWNIAWAVRQHLREITPDDLNNRLHLVALSIKLNTFKPEDLVEWDVLDGLRSPSNVDADLLLHVLEKGLGELAIHPLLIELADVARPHVDPQTYVDLVLTSALKIAYFGRQPGMAVYLAEFCLELQPDNLDILFELSAFYQNSRQYQQGIRIARRCLELVDSLPDRVFASYLLVKSLLNAGGYWDEAIATLKQHEQILQDLIANPPIPLDLIRNSRLNSAAFFFPYIQDIPCHNRQIRQQLFEISRTNMQYHNAAYWEKYQARHQTEWRQKERPQKLKVGYLSHCFNEHSVGWLCRWLMKHHDRDQIDLYLYFLQYQELPGDSLQPHFIDMAMVARPLSANRIEATEAIFEDDLDILVDLDSVTLDVTCNILSLKPAPIQVSWLGWDAIGLSTVDYFLADPYVLPEDAQSYYTEKIWQLPQTYIAVDGFEVGLGNLRRDELQIPPEAVIYFSGQRGYKRHRDTAKLQLEILRQVPDSYFLIKGMADQDAIQQFFYDLAEEVGVDRDRLRFIPEVASELIHRANLAIADVVLDTFPYNGATTTLETLWMGIPLVTRVGEQFAARNSYTMLKNAGIEEGIAWSAAEYVEWGVRFGTDPELRQRVHWQLVRSRQTAPLWNGKQFAREVEAAYWQMWEQAHSESPVTNNYHNK